MSVEEDFNWSNLPEPLIVHIFSYLSVVERHRAARVCKQWLQCLSIPILWKEMKCGFYLPADKGQVKCVELYAGCTRKLTIILNQKEEVNRENALAVLRHLTNMSEMRLTHLTIQFKGDNPLFYSGREFVTALESFFLSISKKVCLHGIKNLNFRGLNSDFDGSFLMKIADSCASLEYLNIINKNLVCNVPSTSVICLINKCKKLKVLHLFHCSLSNDALKALSEPDREPLLRLGVVCRREEKYGEDLSSESWSALMQKSPSLKVEIGFDHTCLLHKIALILKPEIPVEVLQFATYTHITHEVNIASSFYAKSLEKLTVHAKPHKDLEDALLNLVQRCDKLKSLYVFGVLDKAVVEEILSRKPEMKEKGSYILKWEMELEPWVVGQEDED